MQVQRICVLASNFMKIEFEFENLHQNGTSKLLGYIPDSN